MISVGIISFCAGCIITFIYHLCIMRKHKNQLNRIRETCVNKLSDSYQKIVDLQTLNNRLTKLLKNVIKHNN